MKRGKQIGSVDIERQRSQLFASGEMERILENSYDGIWITDGEGRVLYVNSTNEQMLGIRREEVLGRTSAELVTSKLFESSAPLEVIKTGRAVTIKGFNYKTGKNVLITGNPIFDDKGNIKYIITNVRDVSQINKMLDQLKEKDKIINEQRTEIQRLLSATNTASTDGVVAASREMHRILELTTRVARFDSTVLVLGESGAGKEVIARQIVQGSDRVQKPYIKVNCGAIPEALLESELFGYEKGAFTGASQKGKPGMFELANTGTLFLDEIGELQLNLQVKLLRVLQEKEIVRIGGTQPVKLNVRVIAATSQDLEEMVRQKTFRKDLYYRLNVVTIHIPPLRERREDIPPLVHHFLKMYSEKHEVERTITAEAMQVLSGYDWPGNIRELQNVVENLVVMTAHTRIGVEDLDRKFSERAAIADLLADEIIPLKTAVQQVEAELIRRAMEQHKTTRKAAEALGVDQSTIVRKLKTIGTQTE